MSRYRVSLLLVLTLFVQPSSAGDKTRIDPATAIRLVSEQGLDDPVIGVWSGAAGGYDWQTAIVKNPSQKSPGYEFVGVMLRPWPFFKKGEAHIYLNRTSAPGIYEGREKWKSLIGSSWSSARFFLKDAGQLVQLNNIGFSTPLGSDWTLLRQPVPSPAAVSALPFKHAGADPQTATVSSASNATVQSVIFVWFDEEQPRPGTQVIEVVVTARAYEGVLSILREVRGTDTTVRSGFSVLETNYHPPTFQLGMWIGRQSSPETLTSVFLWEDEILGETTPVMDFYMTPRAYESVVSAVQQHFAQAQKSQPLPPEKERRLNSFLRVLGVVAQGALQGMANYYTTVRPIEEQLLALQQAATAQQAAAYASQQHVWELQRLNQQVDRLNTQQLLNQLRRDGEQYSRMLQRYSTGSWSRQ